MENGSAGEARTKALLLDRFWVLERSVDIDGADFIVQRRQTMYRLESGEALLGLVQAKFLQDTSTTVYINPDYVFDENTQARDAFFLVAHTGVEDGQYMYFLTAREIMSNFQRVPAENKKNALKYRLPGAEILVEKYRLSRSQILNSIERALMKADAEKNKTFFSPYVRDVDAYAKPFELNLENCQRHAMVDKDRHEGMIGNVNVLKKKTPKLIADIKHLLLLAQTLKESLDPIEAAYAADELNHEIGELGRAGMLPSYERESKYLSELIKETYSLSFYNKYHREGKWQTWLDALEKFRSDVTQFLLAGVDGSATHLQIEVQFAEDALIGSVTMTAVTIERGNYSAEGRVSNSDRIIRISAPLPKAPADAAAIARFVDNLEPLFEEKFSQLVLWTYKYHHPDNWIGVN